MGQLMDSLQMILQRPGLDLQRPDFQLTRYKIIIKKTLFFFFFFFKYSQFHRQSIDGVLPTIKSIVLTAVVLLYPHWLFIDIGS